MVRPQSPETLERDNRMIRMRIERKTWQEISDALGYAGPAAAHRQWRRRMDERKKAVANSADLHLSELLTELDAMAGEAWAVLNREHVLVSNGTVVRDVDQDGEIGGRIRDDGPTLAAIDRLAKVLAQKAKLLGLEKPATDAAGGVTITIQGVSAEEMP